LDIAKFGYLSFGDTGTVIKVESFSIIAKGGAYTVEYSTSNDGIGNVTDSVVYLYASKGTKIKRIFEEPVDGGGYTDGRCICNLILHSGWNRVWKHRVWSGKEGISTTFTTDNGPLPANMEWVVRGYL
jgi:hypothetical protein